MKTIRQILSLFSISFSNSDIILFLKKVKNKLLLLFLFLLFISSCNLTEKYIMRMEDAYTKYYEKNENTKIDSLEKLQQNQTPKIYYSTNIEDELYEIRAKYHKLLGYSSFTWTSVYKDYQKGALEKMARKHGATTVLYNCKHDTTIKSNSYKTSVSDNGTVTVQSNPDIVRYRYTAYFFVKIKDFFPLLGIEHSNLTMEARKELKQNTGVLITLVYNDTPAYYKNIFRGDVITKINNVEIKNSQHFTELLGKYKKGDTISLNILRDSKEFNVSVDL